MSKTIEQLAAALASTPSSMIDSYYAVQGISHGSWKTLFAPFITANDAIAMRDRLASDNPACKYQAIYIETL